MAKGVGREGGWEKWQSAAKKVDVSEGLQKERKVENAPRVHLSPQ